MGLIYDAFAWAFRDYLDPTIPATGEHEVEKLEARSLGTTIENEIATAVASLPSQEDFDDLQESVDALTSDPENAVTKVPIAVKLLTPIINANATWVEGAGATRTPYWNLPDAVSAYLGFQLEVPSHWATCYFDLYFWNLAATAGNVSFSVEVHNHTEGDSINTTPAGAAVAAAAPTTAWIDGKARVGPITVDPAKRITVRLYRNGAAAGDTLSNAIAFYHLDLVKAS